MISSPTLNQSSFSTSSEHSSLIEACECPVIAERAVILRSRASGEVYRERVMVISSALISTECFLSLTRRPNLPRGLPSRAFCEVTASALFFAIARARIAHLATRARRAHFDRSRGGHMPVLCSAASSAAMRCVRAEFGALACHPAISRYSAGARRGEGHCRACRAPGGLGSCVRAHRRTLHGRTWLPARCRRRPMRPGRPQGARTAAISSRFRQPPALLKNDLWILLIVARP